MPHSRQCFVKAMLSETAIKDFKEVYKAEFGEELSDKEAVELGINLLTLFNHVYKPVKKVWISDGLDNKQD